MATKISQRPQRSATPMAGLFVVLAILIGGFSLFVGFHKATAPLSLLQEVMAWTIHLPVPAGRIIGFLEMAAALALLASIPLRRLVLAGAIGALFIAALNSTGAVIHYLHAETSAYAQSAVIVPLCILLTIVAFARMRRIARAG